MSPPPALGRLGTALVTPFNADGQPDLVALDGLVDRQVAAGVDFLVVLGSTGEAGALDEAQRGAVVARVVARAARRASVVVGTGCASTRTSCAHQCQARALGADAALVVTPPYCRAPPAGFARHLEAMHAAAPLPTLIYNVPARTGTDLTPDQAARHLAPLPFIVGIKDASGRLERVAAWRRLCPGWRLWSGDDATAEALVRLGGDGAISVLSNLAPAAMRRLLAAAAAAAAAAPPPTAPPVAGPSEWGEATVPALLAALAVGQNPQAIKAMLAAEGLMRPDVALPLVPLTASEQARLRGCLGEARAVAGSA